jgi:hypothetical protein
LDYCWRTNEQNGGGVDQNGEYGFCVDGGEHCICNPAVCSPTGVFIDPKCCAVPLVCCNGTGT